MDTICVFWQKSRCPQGANQFHTELCRGHGCLYLGTSRACQGLGHVFSSILSGEIDPMWFSELHVGHDVSCCSCRHKSSDIDAWAALTKGVLSCDPWVSRYPLNLAWASALMIRQLLTTTLGLRLFESYSCVLAEKRVSPRGRPIPH